MEKIPKRRNETIMWIAIGIVIILSFVEVFF